MNLVVLHKLADLQAAGDAGSRAARIAEGLVADASTRIVYHQDESQVPLTRSLLGLSGSEARLISMLSPGQALWRVGRALVRRRPPSLADRDAADQHRHRDERHARAGSAPMRGGRAPGGISDAAMLALIGGAGRAGRRACGCGAASPACCSAAAGRASRAGQLPPVMVRLPARLAHPAARVAAAARGHCSPARPGSTPR